MPAEPQGKHNNTGVGSLYPLPILVVDLPDPGIKPGSPPLQAYSLPTELSGKPRVLLRMSILEIICDSGQLKKKKFNLKVDRFYTVDNTEDFSLRPSISDNTERLKEARRGPRIL